jgi:hypothetical protein
MDNIQKFHTNSNIHSLNRRYERKFHMLNADLTTYQKGAYYAGIKLFSTLKLKLSCYMP